MIKRLAITIAAAMVSATLLSGGLPSVGNGTEPNVWTKNMEGVLAAAKETGYPILLVMINDSVTGEGCSHCWTFVQQTLNNPEFTRIAKTYPFYMVLINLWPGAPGWVSEDYFLNYFFKYASRETFPLVATLKSNGSIDYNAWSQPNTEAALFYAKIEARLSAMVKKSTVLNLSATLDEVPSDSCWTGTVTRTGSSGSTGSVKISLSGANAANYTVSPADISWGSADGSRQFVVSGSAVGGEIISDEILVKITGSGFSGSDISYGTQTKTVLFKDSRVAKTLSQFASANPGLDKLVAGSGAIWYVPKADDGNVLEVCANAERSLVWTATKPGRLAVSSSGKIKVASGKGLFDSFFLPQSETTIGVKIGDTVTFTAIPDGTEGEWQVIGFTKMRFSPLTVSAVTPENGCNLNYYDLCNDSSLGNMSWSSTGPKVSEYKLFCTTSGIDKVFSDRPAYYSGTETSVNSLEVGFLTTNYVMGACQWGVRATVLAEHGVAVAQTSSAFTISSLPAFDNVPADVTVYLKAGSSINLGTEAMQGVEYSAKNLPAGLSIDKTTGIISGTPKRVASKTITITAKNGSSKKSVSVKMKAVKLPSSVKKNYAGIFFNNRSQASASMTWKTATNGKWTGTIQSGGVKTKVGGTMVFDVNGAITLESDKLTVVGISGTSFFTSKWNGMTLLGRTAASLGSKWTGTWNAALFDSQYESGYAAVSVKSSGTVNGKGKLSASKKLAFSGNGVVIPSSIISQYLADWDRGKDCLFSYGYKKASGGAFDGGFAFYADGLMVGMFSFGGKSFDADKAFGSKWTKRSLLPLDKSPFAAFVDEEEEFSFTVSATESKLSALPGSFAKSSKAKLSCSQKTGIFKGSFMVGSAKCKFEGALMLHNGELVGIGGGSSGKDVFSVSINTVE